MSITSALARAFPKSLIGNLTGLGTALDAAYAPKDLGSVLASAYVGLSQTTPNSTSHVQWGTEEAVVAQADCPTAAVVMAWVAGSMIGGPGSLAVTDRGAVKLQFSFDGGGSWADDSGGEALSALNQANTTSDQPISIVGRATGTVTGDVQVRAMVRDVSAANDTTWRGGRLAVLVHPQ